MAQEISSVAFLGTGIMGLPMARRIAQAGFQVRAWNRSSEKAEPLRSDGATVCTSPAEAAQGADAVITMLTDIDAVEAVMAGDGGALAAMGSDAVWLQMSTVGVAGCERLAALAADRSVPFVDAPVLGTKQPAENGKLKVFAAGSPDLRERVEPVFAPMGSLAVWLDEVGQASAFKLVANSWVLAMTDALAASIALARAYDLDPQLFLDAIEGSGSDTPYAHVKGPMMIHGEYPPSFSLSAALKDANLVVAAGADRGITDELVVAVRDHLQRAADAGHGDEDMSAMYYGHSAPGESAPGNSAPGKSAPGNREP